jgi:hypothetical protein
MATEVRTVPGIRSSPQFVGRDAELGSLLTVLDEAGPVLVYVHGIAGVGKSALVSAFTDRARSAGATVVPLDCRSVEPTDRGFIHSLASAVGSRASTLGAVAERIGRLGNRVVVVLDTYEVFRFLDTWLRETFLSSLGAHVRLVLAGREPPVRDWLAAARWQARVRSVALEPLGDAAALALLAWNGVGEREAVRINRFVHGHPLALRLAAATLAERPDRSLESETIPMVVASLARTYLADVGDPVTRSALNAAASVRRVTRSLLQAMLPNVAPDEALERLQALPFVYSGRDGLIVHDAVRDAIAGHLRSTDPTSYRELRRRAWQLLRDEVRTAGIEELWRYTADVLYILENPVIREAFFPSGGPQYTVEVARGASDQAAIEQLAAMHETPRAAAAAGLWLKQRPESFHVARDRDRAVRGFYAMFSPNPADAPLVEQDPIASGWQRHIDAHPMPYDQRPVFVRYLLSEQAGEMQSPEQAACWLDMKRTYMVMRPQLRRIYMALREPAQGAFQPVIDKLGFESCGAVEVGGDRYYLNVNDFGPESVDGWLGRLVAAELGVDVPELLDRRARELVLGRERVPVTRLEFGVLEYLLDREGQAVSRVSLIRDVWGHTYTGGSNVVEAVIRSLRKKLGERAACVETVSGVGYRYRSG